MSESQSHPTCKKVLSQLPRLISPSLKGHVASALGWTQGVEWSTVPQSPHYIWSDTCENQSPWCVLENARVRKWRLRMQRLCQTYLVSEEGESSPSPQIHPPCPTSSALGKLKGLHKNAEKTSARSRPPGSSFKEMLVPLPTSLNPGDGGWEKTQRGIAPPLAMSRFSALSRDLRPSLVLSTLMVSRVHHAVPLQTPGSAS
ncbi:uncharacterized protein LOC123643364 [Lemur catta]|uniref:uncharacterized protein LOC123643364 n=1 Tax=Lemur catta TaxID=9447 RepID=UPI001E2672AB|nr:uncharacterized protein LOC123643364 [Lemur catta]